MRGKIFIHSSKADSSKRTEDLLRKKLDNVGFSVCNKFTSDATLLVSIGGDGTFLDAIHKFDFPDIPIIGINTGHLGFFEEIMPNQLDDFIFNYTNSKYSIQNLSTVQAIVKSQGAKYTHTALNEIVVRGKVTRSVHLNLSIGGSFIQRLSGDGLVVSTPAGSTAYNYSLRGGIVDPRLKLLQVTPIAPMNTTAYRSFTSSVLLPPDLSIEIAPDKGRHAEGENIQLFFDGFKAEHNSIDEIEVKFAEETVKLLRFESYDFWRKVKNKFL